MRAAFAVLALLLAGCTTPAAHVEAPPELPLDAEGFTPVLFGAHAFEELDLAVEDGLRLHADVYLPDEPLAADAPTKHPAILVLSPYWGAGTRGEPEIGYLPYDFLVERLLPRGYAIVYGDLAGNGGSSGCWDFMGPVERAASVAMVEAVAAQPWSDGRVGMMGLSYDGMTQIMAASDAPPHLVTVVPASPLTSAYSGLRMNGVHYGGNWHQTILGYEQSTLMPPAQNEGRVPGWMETVQRSPECMAENHAGDATGAYNDYYAARDYRALGSEVEASVFYMQGFLDPAVKPDNFGAWFEAVPTLKKAWLGHWYHQYPDATGGGRTDLYLTLHRWFDHTLKGVDNGIDREPRVDVMDSLARWRREDAWPPADARVRVLQLSADGTLVGDGAKEGSVMAGGVLGVGSRVSGALGAARFELELPEGAHMAGRPVLDVVVTSDRPGGILVARLWDGDRLVSQGAYNLLFAGGLDAPSPPTPGEPVHLRFELYPTDHAIRPGGTLALEVTTQDALGWFDPDATIATLTVQAGPETILELPLIERGEEAFFLTSCGASFERYEPGCYRDLEDEGVEP